ncbi:MAG: PIN domain nuclease [Bacteroidetes bacterium]|nr:PIN domain nuclease [Bacteroidota bacterium]
MLFDSSIWIDYFRGVKNASTQVLDTNLERVIRGYICPPILQEVLQGIKRDKDYLAVKESLIRFHFLYLDSYFVAEEAAKIYRELRKKGVTIRKPNDCIIAFYAIHFNLKLVHNDADFNKIARHTALKVYKT